MPDVLGPAQIALLCHQEGWRGENLVVAVAVALGESEGDARAYNGSGGDLSYGLFQVNMRGTLGPDRRTRYSLQSNEDLYTPKTNVRVAYDIWVTAGHSFVPWGAFTSGGYKKYGRYERAKAGVAALTDTSQGLHYDPHGTPPYSGGPRPGAVKLRDILKAKWPAINVGYPFGIYSERPSEHGDGRAIDCGLNANNPSHQVIAERLTAFCVENAARYGIQSVIWNRQVWGFGKWYWRQYTGPSPHTDHVHVGLNKWGAQGNWNEEEDMTPELKAEFDFIRAEMAKLWKALYEKRDGEYVESVQGVKPLIEAAKAEILAAIQGDAT